MAELTGAQAALEALAWDRWFELDFSWDGLKKPVILKARWGEDRDIKDGLQDHWRHDPATGTLRSDEELIAAGELIVEAGQKTYHIAHLPLFYDVERNLPTVKTTSRRETFRKLKDLLESRMKAQRTEQADDDILDINIELPGCVIDYVDYFHEDAKETRFYLNLDHAVILNSLALSKRFVSYLSVTQASFIGSLRIDDDQARYAGASSEAQSCYFDACYFVGRISAWQVKTEFELTFDNCRLAGAFGCYESVFSVGFENTELSNSVQLHGCEGREITFTNCKLNSDIWVTNCRFRDRVEIDGTEFTGGVNFLGSKFLGEASFSSVTFQGALSFKACEIGRFQFTTIGWPDDLTKCSRAFERCTFHEMADFTGSGIRAFAAFDSAWFEKGLRFDPLPEDVVKAEFKRELPKPGASGCEELLGQIESGCRSLKQAMEKAANKPLEQLFYRFELQARRRQKKTAPAEKFISVVYAHYSDYGASYWRPFYGLASMLVVFALVYGLMDGTFVIPWFGNVGSSLHNFLRELSHHNSHSASFDGVLGTPKDWLITVDLHNLHEVVATSASRIFPFGAFEDVSKAFAEELPVGWSRLTYRLLATFESFMALALAFMFGLAVRRRFQID